MADKNLTSDITAASALDGTELVHVVQSGNSRKATAQAIADLGVIYTRTTLTFSADATKTFAIPAGTKRIHMMAVGLVGSAVGKVLSIAINKQSDGAAGSFKYASYAYDTAGDTTASATGTTPASVWNGGSTDEEWHLDIVVEDPRSGTAKTMMRAEIMSSGTQTGNQETRTYLAVAATAEDHDEIVFSVDTGTLTGTIEIKYET